MKNNKFKGTDYISPEATVANLAASTSSRLITSNRQALTLFNAVRSP